MLLNARCILEGLAIKRKFEKGEIPESRVALLQKQVFLIEYKYYSRFDDIADIILFGWIFLFHETEFPCFP